MTIAGIFTCEWYEFDAHTCRLYFHKVEFLQERGKIQVGDMFDVVSVDFLRGKVMAVGENAVVSHVLLFDLNYQRKLVASFLSRSEK